METGATLCRQARRRGVPASASQSDLPSISVVVPSLQQGRFIGRTLSSVLGQEYPHLEVLVVDGGSSDETLAILDRCASSYPDTLSYVSEEDRNQAHAVNKGFARAGGEIIGWLNSDDTYQPGALMRAADAFRRNPDYDLIYGRAQYVSADDQNIGPYPSRVEFDWNALADECYICQPTVFFRRRLLDNGYFLDERLDYCCDYDYWIRLGRHFRIRFVDSHLANARVHDAAKSVRFRTPLIEEAVRTVRRHYGFLPVSWALALAHERNGRVHTRAAATTLPWRTYLRAARICLAGNYSRPLAWRRVARDIGARARRKAFVLRHAPRYGERIAPSPAILDISGNGASRAECEGSRRKK